MSDKTLTPAELEAHLKEQAHFIKASSDAYDNGHEIEAKRIALAIRILVHDTNSSHSLLKQMNKKTQIQYIDSTLDGSLMSAHALVGMRITNKSGQKSGYSPRLDRYKDKYKKIAFDTWWNQIVCKDKHGNTLSRQNLILIMANKDGGAHVDSKISTAYEGLKYDNAMGWTFTNGSKQGPLEDMLYASVRQIAYELIESLKLEKLTT